MQQVVTKARWWQWMLTVCVLFIFNSCNDKDPYDPYANYDYDAHAKADEEMIQAYMKQNNYTDTVKTSTGLYLKVIKPSTAANPVKPVAGQKVKVNYVGKLMQDGYVFDSSYKRGVPFQFTVGAGQVIKGWDEGLLMMHVGETALLMIPSNLGYGARGSYPNIPSGAPLVFEVTLMEIL